LRPCIYSITYFPEYRLSLELEVSAFPGNDLAKSLLEFFLGLASTCPVVVVRAGIEVSTVSKLDRLDFLAQPRADKGCRWSRLLRFAWGRVCVEADITSDSRPPSDSIVLIWSETRLEHLPQNRSLIGDSLLEDEAEMGAEEAVNALLRISYSMEVEAANIIGGTLRDLTFWELFILVGYEADDVADEVEVPNIKAGPNQLWGKHAVIVCLSC
jgi:hypothetical protein